jgi:predicted AAA+ superfamily ATPase
MIKRLSKLSLLLKEFSVVVITGPRQVGKTTLARQAASTKKQVVYLDMELESDRRRLFDLENFFSSHRDKLVVIDEVQLMPEIFSALRPEVDAMRKPGRFLLTGSANPLMIKGVAESLAGRVAYMELTPFMLNEVMPKYNMQRHWFRGGYPNAFLAKTDDAFHRWMENYIETFVQRDLRVLFGSDLSTVITRNLWSIIAHNNGGILNAEHYSRALGITGPTIKRYLQFLEAAFLIRLLPPWFANSKKRLVKAPKIFIRDSGVLHQLTNIETANSLAGHLVIGASWEGYVTEEIIRHLPSGVTAFFYRTHHGAEIDLVLVKNNKPLYAIEIKHSKAPVLSNGFYNAITDLKTTKNYLIYSGEEEYVTQHKIIVCGLKEFIKKHLV